MDDFGEELEEIKREIVESRSLTIKTNNLVNGLSADVHSIGKRQQGYERSLKFSSVGFYVLVLGVVLLGAKFVIDARVDAERAVSKDLRDDVERLEKQVKQLEARDEARSQAERRAAEFQELIVNQNRAEVLRRWPDVSKLALTAAERASFERAVERFRIEASALAYATGLDYARAERWHEAERALRSALEDKEDSPHAEEARFQLARALRALGRPREAVSVLLELTEGSNNAELGDDAMLLLAETQIDLEAWGDAKNTLRSFARRFPNSPLKDRAHADLAKLNDH